MQYAAQPAGTTAAQALVNRGPDPELIAPNNYAFFKSLRLLLHPQPRAGNNKAVLQSSVVSVIGKYFIVTDPFVLGTPDRSALITDAALASLVAYIGAHSVLADLFAGADAGLRTAAGAA